MGGKAMSPLHSRGPQRKRGEQNQKYVPHPGLLKGPNEGGNATSPLHSRGPPAPSVKRKSEGATSTLPFQGPINGRKCYVTPAFSGFPNAKTGNKIRSGDPTPAFSEAHEWAEWLCNRFILKGPKTREQNQKWLPHPCLRGGPKRGWPCYVTLAFSRIPNASAGNKIRSGYLIPALSRPHKQGGTTTSHPCILGGHERQRGGKNQKWLPQPCLLGSQKEGGIGKPPLHSREGPTPSAGTAKCLTPTVSRAHKWAELLSKPCILGGPHQQARGEIRNGYLTPAFSGAHNQAE